MREIHRGTHELRGDDHDGLTTSTHQQDDEDEHEEPLEGERHAKRPRIQDPQQRSNEFEPGAQTGASMEASLALAATLVTSEPAHTTALPDAADAPMADAVPSTECAEGQLCVKQSHSDFLAPADDPATVAAKAAELTSTLTAPQSVDEQKAQAPMETAQ